MTRKPDTTPGRNAQRRAALYHVLLLEVRSMVRAFRISGKGDGECPFCANLAWFADRHFDGCLIRRLEAALDAERRGDNEAIKRMLEEIGAQKP